QLHRVDTRAHRRGGERELAVGRGNQAAVAAEGQRLRRADRGAVDVEVGVPHVGRRVLDEIHHAVVGGAERVVGGERRGLVVAGRIVQRVEGGGRWRGVGRQVQGHLHRAGGLG